MSTMHAVWWVEALRQWLAVLQGEIDPVFPDPQ